MTSIAAIAPDSDIAVSEPCADENRASRGRPRDTEKTRAILEAAGALFMEHGFEGTSMDEVAKLASVSKQTVYSHFSSKEQLFGEAVHHKIEAHYPEIVVSRLATHTLEGDLMAVAENYARLLLSDDAMMVHRVLVTAAPKGTELARIFWDAGPMQMMEKLGDFIKTWVDRGELELKDPKKAGMMLISLLKGALHFRMEIGLVSDYSEEEFQDHVHDAVNAFLAIYRKR